MDKKDKLLYFINEIDNFRFCSPSADPDEQTAVVYGFKHLVKRFLGYARKIQNQEFQESLSHIDPDIEDIYAVYDLNIDLQVVLDDLKELLSEPSTKLKVLQNEYIDSVLIETLEELHNERYDLTKVVEFSKEINGTFSSGYYLATSLLIRALLNHVPPIFGYEKFSQIVAQSSRSRKDLFRPLDEIARDVADLHSHDLIRHKEHIPTDKQLEPFKANLEFLLQEIITEIHKAGNS